MNIRKQAVTTALSAILLGSALALAPTANAASYPNQNWSQTSQNSSGVVFRPYGDHFEIWDNVDNGAAAFAYYNYKGVDDAWKRAGSVTDGHADVSHNVYESIDGKHAYIYFEVCDTVRGCSKPSWYRTWGS